MKNFQMIMKTKLKAKKIRLQLLQALLSQLQAV